MAAKSAGPFGPALSKDGLTPLGEQEELGRR